MNVAVFIPCYIDQLFPKVGLATVDLLERFGLNVSVPDAPSCCGQPMANMGAGREIGSFASQWVKAFAPFDAVVCPSGSCTHMIVHEYEHWLHDDPTYASVRARTFELCQFLTRKVGLDRIGGRYAKKVGLHRSCHGLRGLRLGPGSERMETGDDLQDMLLRRLEGIELVSLQRRDECCGFGGSFAVSEAAVSTRMGLDRLQDHLSAGAEEIVAGDSSCLMHLMGLASRQKLPLTFRHIAEVLAEAGS